MKIKRKKISVLSHCPFSLVDISNPLENLVLFITFAGRMWCHCRMVYLPMSYLYGKRFVGPITPTVLSLRRELYNVPYHEIDWDRARNECAKVMKLSIILWYC